MEPTFCQLGLAFADLVRAALPASRAGRHRANATKPSQWAHSQLQFTPNPKQAEVLDSSARFLILCCNRQWGKTTTIAIKALHHALHHPNQTIVIISRTKRQAGILISRATHFALSLRHKTRRVHGYDFSLHLPNGSQIIAVPHNTDTSVGNTAQVLIVDEAALVRDDVYFSVSPAVGRTKGAIWLLSTPRRQAGFFYNIWHDTDSRWHKIFSPVTDCPEIDPEFLDMQRRADETKFRQDFLCEFLQPPQFLFSRQLIENLWSH